MKLLALVAALATSVLAAAPATATPPAAHFHSYVRDWVGHTRSLDVRHDHTARESIYDGCCTHVITVRMVLDDVRGTAQHGSVRATVTRVAVFAPSYFDAQHPAPAVGDVTRLRLRDGVLTDPLTGGTYCDAQARPGACGA